MESTRASSRTSKCKNESSTAGASRVDPMANPAVPGMSAGISQDATAEDTTRASVAGEAPTQHASA